MELLPDKKLKIRKIKMRYDYWYPHGLMPRVDQKLSSVHMSSQNIKVSEEGCTGLYPLQRGHCTTETEVSLSTGEALGEAHAGEQPHEHGRENYQGCAKSPGATLPFLSRVVPSLEKSSEVDIASLPGARPWNPGLLLINMVASAVIILCL